MKTFTEEELVRIEKFKKLLGLVAVCKSGKNSGQLYFREQDFIHMKIFHDLKLDSDLPFLMEKLNNAIKLISENPEFINKDIEEDIWHLI